MTVSREAQVASLILLTCVKFRVKAGKWPQGTRDGGNVYWFIEDLDAALDRLKPVGAKGREPDGWGDYLNGET
jgi:hypothetical protein